MILNNRDILFIFCHPHVTGVAPFTQLQGMLTAQGQVAGIMVTGIDPKCHIFTKHNTKFTLFK
jgi:ABC-type lipoprotein release transport system permease subunit